MGKLSSICTISKLQIAKRQTAQKPEESHKMVNQQSEKVVETLSPLTYCKQAYIYVYTSSKTRQNISLI